MFYGQDVCPLRTELLSPQCSGTLVTGPLKGRVPCPTILLSVFTNSYLKIQRGNGKSGKGTLSGCRESKQEGGDGYNTRVTEKQ